MSAFLVSKQHINALVAWVMSDRLGSDYANAGTFPEVARRCAAGATLADAIGRVLWAENLRSVQTRYPDCKASPGEIHPDTPGAVEGESIEEWTYRPESARNAVQTISACRCLEYQSCETDNWLDTEAHKILDRIMHDAIRRLPGMDEASWEITEYEGSGAIPLMQFVPQRKRK